MDPLQKNLRLRSAITLPIYGLKIYLYVSLDSLRTYQRVAKCHGFPAEDDGFQAMTVSNHTGAFGLFFHIADLNESLIAHEVKHLTDMIEEYLSARHCQCPHCREKRDERDAYVCGYLTTWVKNRLKRARIRVK